MTADMGRRLQGLGASPLPPGSCWGPVSSCWAAAGRWGWLAPFSAVLKAPVTVTEAEQELLAKVVSHRYLFPVFLRSRQQKSHVRGTWVLFHTGVCSTFRKQGAGLGQARGQTPRGHPPPSPHRRGSSEARVTLWTRLGRHRLLSLLHLVRHLHGAPSPSQRPSLTSVSAAGHPPCPPLTYLRELAVI